MANVVAGVGHRSILSANRPSSRILIDNHVRISRLVFLLKRKTIIKNYVNLGVSVAVYDNDFNPVDACGKLILDKKESKLVPVCIYEDAWTDAQAVILKGVTIGLRTAIGTGCVVT